MLIYSNKFRHNILCKLSDAFKFVKINEVGDSDTKIFFKNPIKLPVNKLNYMYMINFRDRVFYSSWYAEVISDCKKFLVEKIRKCVTKSDCVLSSEEIKFKKEFIDKEVLLVVDRDDNKIIFDNREK